MFCQRSAFFLSTLLACINAAPITNQCQNQVINHTFDQTDASAFLAFPGWNIESATQSTQRVVPVSSPNVATFTFPIDPWRVPVPAAATVVAPEGIKFNLQSFYVGGQNATWLNLFGYTNSNDKFPVVAKQLGLDRTRGTAMQKVDVAQWGWPDVGMVHFVLSEGGNTEQPVSFAIDNVVAVKKC